MKFMILSNGQIIYRKENLNNIMKWNRNERNIWRLFLFGELKFIINEFLMENCFEVKN